jgi:hypothetical protein
MRYWVALALIFAIFAAANAGIRPAHSQNLAIVGDYTAQGTYPDKSPYTGTVTITSTRQGFRFDWLIDGTRYRGTSTGVNGTTITVDWGDDYPAIYVVGQDGVLRGTWDNGKATEILTRK